MTVEGEGREHKTDCELMIELVALHQLNVIDAHPSARGDEVFEILDEMARRYPRQVLERVDAWL
jgi:hypothetical protein